MERQIGFYYIVPGISVYFILLMALIYFIVTGPYSFESGVIMTYISLLTYPASLFLTKKGNDILKVMNIKKAMWLSIIPFPFIVLFAFLT